MPFITETRLLFSGTSCDDKIMTVQTTKNNEITHNRMIIEGGKFNIVWLNEPGWVAAVGRTGHLGSLSRDGCLCELVSGDDSALRTVDVAADLSTRGFVNDGRTDDVVVNMSGILGLESLGSFIDVPRGFFIDRGITSFSVDSCLFFSCGFSELNLQPTKCDEKSAEEFKSL
ncbi:hypothetical protein Salat_0193300 [Sesamum alatum]|uniref:Uncharacterized protein n=1 Tax=Sesamum alatum TaxID=300844 RepID=A0AAE2CXX7_9LAMI|nr:hypothetical protein Salat_0193300 [Sesamum alatum]